MSVKAIGSSIFLPIFLQVTLSIALAAAAESVENLTSEGSALEKQGRYEEAELAYRKALKAAPDDLQRARAGNRLASLYQRQDRYAEAERLFRSALRWRQQNLAASSVEVAYSLNNLGELYHAEGREWEARSLLEASADHLERFHKDAEGLPLILGNLAVVLCHFGELDRAEVLLRQALEYHAAASRESRDYAVTLSDMAQVLELKQEPDGAARFYQQAIGIFERVGERGKVDLAAALADEGTLYQRLGQMEESRRDELRALELLPASSDRALRAQVLRNLGNLEAGAGHASDSLRYFEESLVMQEQALGAEHPATAALLLDYSSATLRAGNKSLARKLRQRAMDLLERLSSRSPEQMTVSLRDLGTAAR